MDNMAATTRITYVLIDPTDMARVDELKRLRREREKKFSIVTEEWVCARAGVVKSHAIRVILSKKVGRRLGDDQCLCAITTVNTVINVRGSVAFWL